MSYILDLWQELIFISRTTASHEEFIRSYPQFLDDLIRIFAWYNLFQIFCIIDAELLLQ